MTGTFVHAALGVRRVKPGEPLPETVAAAIEFCSRYDAASLHLVIGPTGGFFAADEIHPVPLLRPHDAWIAFARSIPEQLRILARLIVAKVSLVKNDNRVDPSTPSGFHEVQDEMNPCLAAILEDESPFFAASSPQDVADHEASVGGVATSTVAQPEEGHPSSGDGGAA